MAAPVRRSERRTDCSKSIKYYNLAEALVKILDTNEDPEGQCIIHYDFVSMQ